jgi:hypothetical protein
MKNIRLSLSQTKCFAILLFTAMLLIVNSCKKYVNQSDPGFNGNQIDLSLLKSIYNNDTTNATTSVSMIKNRDVKWDRIYFQQRAKSRVMEFDLNNDGHIWTMSPNPQNYFNKNSFVFLDFNDGTHLDFYMKTIEDHTDKTKKSVLNYVHYNTIPSNFNGAVLFYSLNNKFINGYQYIKGKITGKYLPTKSATINGGNILSVTPKTTTLYQETDCYYDYTNTGWTDPDTGEYHPVKSTGSTDCYTYYYGDLGGDSGGGGDTGGVTGDNGLGGGGGSSNPNTPPSGDCNTPTGGAVANSIIVTGGHAVVQQVAGGGDCPPKAPPISPIDTIQDAIDPKFQCAKSILAQLPTLRNDLATLLNKVFNGNTPFIVTFHDGNSTDFASHPDEDGICRNTANNTWDIYLNPTVLQNASNEYLIVTMYHEALHAYLQEENNRLGDAAFKAQYPYVKVFTSWHIGNNGQQITDYYIDEGLYQTQIDPQHTIMADYYTKSLVNAILSYNPNFDVGRANDLARWGIYKDSSNLYGNNSERDRTQGNSIGTTCP